MASRFFTKAAAGLAFSQVVAAQLYSNCNPTKKTDCDPNPAVGDNSITVDFTQGASDEFTVLPGTAVTYDAEKGAVFSISKDSDSPTMVGTKYIFYGRIDVVVQAAAGSGIVTALTLQSEDLDEIDLEWVGYDTTHVQTNYFSQGITGIYDRGGFSETSNNCFENFHTYSMDWTAERLDWLIDDVVVRTLVRNDNVADAYRYPQTPSRLRVGTWVAGQASQAQGTIDWAGGYANYSNAPFEAYVQSLTITDYANGVSGAIEYVWTDQSGSDESIEVVTEKDEANSTTSAVDATTTGTGPDDVETSAVDDASTTCTDDAATATSTDGDEVSETGASGGDEEDDGSDYGDDEDCDDEDEEDEGSDYDDGEDCDDEDEGEGDGEETETSATAADSTTLVVPTTCTTTDANGAVTTVVVDVTITVPCDEDGTPITDSDDTVTSATDAVASSTIVVVPTTAVTTADNGEATTVIVDVTITVPCDQDGTPITEVDNSASTSPVEGGSDKTTGPEVPAETTCDDYDSPTTFTTVVAPTGGACTGAGCGGSNTEVPSPTDNGCTGAGCGGGADTEVAEPTNNGCTGAGCGGGAGTEVPEPTDSGCTGAGCGGTESEVPEPTGTPGEGSTGGDEGSVGGDEGSYYGNGTVTTSPVNNGGSAGSTSSIIDSSPEETGVVVSGAAARVPGALAALLAVAGAMML